MPPTQSPRRAGRSPDSVPSRIERYLAARPNDYLRPVDLASKLDLPTHLTAVMLARSWREERISRTHVPVRGWKRLLTAYGCTEDQATAIRALWEGVDD